MYATQTIRNRFGLLGSQANQSVVFVLVYLMEIEIETEKKLCVQGL